MASIVLCVRHLVRNGTGAAWYRVRTPPNSVPGVVVKKRYWKKNNKNSRRRKIIIRRENHRECIAGGFDRNPIFFPMSTFNWF